MSYTNKYIIEGIDRLGKDTLINGILNKRGFHQVLHYSIPLKLAAYNHGTNGHTVLSDAEEEKLAYFQYQRASFRTMFTILRDATFAHMIFNRAHLGECVYAPLYRGYSGDYIFDLEEDFKIKDNTNVRLILLTEDFDVAEHFVDDGESLGSIKNRRIEQELFLAAFEQSKIRDKRIICVTDPAVGGFKPKEWILNEALAN